MKSKLITKLAVAAVLVCAAVGSRAGVNVSWYFKDVTSSASDGRDGTTLAGKNQYMTYLFVESGAKNSENKESFTTLDSVLSLLNANNKTFSDKAYAYGKNNYYYDTTSSADFIMSGTIGSISDSVKAFAIVLDATSLSAAKNYMIVNCATHNDIYGDYSAPAGKNVQLAWGSQSNNSWVAIGSVPEPTSGVLLLVGVAALALKRKKAA